MLKRAVFFDSFRETWVELQNATRSFEARSSAEVMSRLSAAEEYLQQEGGYLAGFLAYEAAPAFDSALKTHPPAGIPCLLLTHWESCCEKTLEECFPRGLFALEPWTVELSAEGYAQKVASLQERINRGDSYQVNFSFPLRSSFSGEPAALFGELARAQQGSSMAFLETDEFAICCASPELFFARQGHQVTMRPMKGTAPRGLFFEDDRERAKKLWSSEKERAENVMITDMVRNDLAKIASGGSVSVSRLLSLEQYPTVWQLTSEVHATSDKDFPQILSAVFPCASVTGAPKPRTMELIHEHEEGPRGVYTGALGFWSKERAMLSVPIRTLSLDKRSHQAVYRTGSGIIAESVPEREYAECLLKAQVLIHRQPTFALLETMLWEPDAGYFLLDSHLERLRRSALYFGFPYDKEQLLDSVLFSGEGAHNWDSAHRVRLLLYSDGTIETQFSEIELQERREPHVALATHPVDSSDVFLYHKTSHREVYDRHLMEHPEADDVILYNERGEVTETCLGNIALRFDGKLLTPPVRAGLLAGVYRDFLLRHGVLREETLTTEHLALASEVYIMNSVRGLSKVQLTATERIQSLSVVNA